MRTKKLRLIKIILVLSLILNSYFVSHWVNEPDYKLGILTENIEVGIWGQQHSIFKLPRGLTVQNVSPKGFAAIGQFEPYRFSISISTNDLALTNYAKQSKKSEFGALYSASVK